MLLNSDTAVKVAHDIIHDAEEFFKKWPLLAGAASAAPEGYVDFEFSDGYLLRVPCAWYTLLLNPDNIISRLILKNGGQMAIWAPGIIQTGTGSLSGVISDSPIVAGEISTEDIVAFGRQTSDIALISATAGSIAAISFKIKETTVLSLTVKGKAYIYDGVFDNLIQGNAVIDINLDNLYGDSLIAEECVCTGETIVPVEKMNAWQENESAPKTDALYSGAIPFRALDGSGNPINGYDNPLVSNPFYPDWFYVSSSRVFIWRPNYVWVPSRTVPSSPYWKDSDRIYWYQVNTQTSASQFGTPHMVFPPRFGSNYPESILPPLKADADGMVVTVQILDEGVFSICVSDKYTYIDETAWSWSPGKTIQVNGPCIAQFIAKRMFAETSGRITSVEYQFLPLGEIDAAT